MTTQTFERTERQKELIRLLAGPARHCLVYGGSRSGKTFGLCDAVATRAIKAPGSRHVIFRRHGVAVKQSIGLDTMPKVIGLKWPGLEVKWREQDGYFKLQNGSEIWLAGLDDKDRVDKVLGREFATLYFNEASEIPYASYQVALTRLAQKVEQADKRPLTQKVYVDLNPTTRTHWTYRLWIDGVEPEEQAPVNRALYAVLTMNPLDNTANLSADYIASLEALPERQKKRFFLGEYTGDVEHALWRREHFKRVQRDERGRLSCDMARLVVAVDPAVSNDTGSDETGIVAAGVGTDGCGYVIQDDSGRYRPEEWARRAIALYEEHGADRIVAEVNQGGDMVEHTLRAQGFGGSFEAVRASRGKVTRAEPVAALYERGKVFHVGAFPELEDQCCSFTSDFDRKAQGYSPDRVDALVWAFTSLFPSMTRRKAASGAINYPSMGTIA